MAAMVVAGIVSQLYLNEPAYGVSNLYVQSLKSLGKGSFWGRGQIVLLIIRLNTLVDFIRVPKVRTSGE